MDGALMVVLIDNLPLLMKAARAAGLNPVVRADGRLHIDPSPAVVNEFLARHLHLTGEQVVEERNLLNPQTFGNGDVQSHMFSRLATHNLED
jgi:hypothetical protein